MLHTLLASGEFTDVVCEYVDAIDYDCKNMLRIYFWDHDKSGNPRCGTGRRRTGRSTSDRRSPGRFLWLAMMTARPGSLWSCGCGDEPWGRCEVCWNSYDALLQSDRCVIR